MLIIILGILSVMALAGILHVFLSKKSTSQQKKAALVALVLIGLAIAALTVVLILFGFGNTEEELELPLEHMLEKAQQTNPQSNFLPIIILLVIFLAFLGFMLFINRKQQQKPKK